MKWKKNGYTLMKVRSTERAYTLIEILVVLTIISLLFSFGYAGFRDFSRRQALASLSKQIQGDLRLAQQMSFSGKKPTECGSNTLDGIRFGVTTTPPYLYRLRATCGGGSVTSDVIKEFIFSSDITPVVAQGSPNPLLFKVLGQGTNIDSGDWVLTLTQTGTGNVATVTVTTGGEIR